MTIDLAGSEKADDSKGLQDETYLEGNAINKSLLDLGKLFRQMAAGIPPFGASYKFTKYLQTIICSSFKNSKLVMVAHVSSEEQHETSTDTTLQRAFEATQVERKTVAKTPINSANQQQQGKK